MPLWNFQKKWRINQMSKKLVLACENENATALIEGVGELLNEKVLIKLSESANTIALTLLNNSSDWTDQYERFDPQIQEAIDVVIEKVENGDDIKKSISEVASKKNVAKEKLDEYFNSMSEDTVTVDSTKETGNHSQNHDAMNDMDVNKRVRYESKEYQGTAKELMEVMLDLGAVLLEADDSYVEISDPEKNALKKVFYRLNESNQERFMELLTENRSGFIKMVNFCLKAA
jgi:hypothetical protein